MNKKLTALIVMSLLSYFSFGQNYSVNKKHKSYFGLTGGINFSMSKITDRYAVLNSVGSTDDEGLQKEYTKFTQNRGVQFGIRYNYNFTNTLSVVAGFGYRSVGFSYLTNYSWTDTLDSQDFSREMFHNQKISYFTLPIMGRWDMTQGQLKPYVQAGLYMDFRHQAKKVIHYDNQIDEEVDEETAAASPTVSIKDDTRKFNMGVMGGLGINYYTKYLTFGIESNFRYGFMKVITDDSRYFDPNGFALQYLDVLDQLKMSALNVQLTVSVPITQSIQSNILRRRNYHKKR